MLFYFYGTPFRNVLNNRWIWPSVFTFHVLAGLAFLYIYTFLEGDGTLSQDAGAYMLESKILNNVFYESPLDYFKLIFGLGDTEALTQYYLMDTNHWDMGSQAISNESRNMIRLHSIIQFFSFNRPEVHILFMSLASSLSVYFLFGAIQPRSKFNPILSIVLLTLLPNVLFWTSGILKEPLYILGFSMIFYSLSSKRNSFSIWLTFAIGIVLLLLFKLHFLLIVLFGMGMWQISRAFSQRKVLYSALTGLGAIAILFSVFSSVREQFTNTISRKQFDFKNISKGGLHADTDSCYYYFNENQLKELDIHDDSVSAKRTIKALKLGYNEVWPPDTLTLSPEDGKWKIHFQRDKSDSYFEMGDIQNNFLHLVGGIPEALLNSFFRPFPTETGGWFKWVSILEYLFVWAIFLYSFRWVKGMENTTQETFIFLMTIIVISALLVGWTTPVSNAIVRYRVPIHLSMVLIILLNWNNTLKSHE